MTATFPLIPRRRVLGLPFGAPHSVRRGIGSDVAASRPYEPGDDVDRIDWYASARLSLARASDEFIVREHFAEEAPRVVVLCDRRPSMSLFDERWPWIHKPAAIRECVQLIGDGSRSFRSSFRIRSGSRASRGCTERRSRSATWTRTGAS